jgi:hypothetical protein
MNTNPNGISRVERRGRRSLFASTAVLSGLMIRGLILLLALITRASARADELTDFFQQTQFTGHFMKENPSPHLLEISAKMLKAAQQNKEWLVNYLKSRSEPGKPLPYHPNLGVTEAEYREFLEQAPKAPLKEVARFEIKIVKGAGGEMKLDTQGKVPLFEQCSFYPGEEKIVIPEGTLEKPDTSGKPDGGGIIGPWRGLTFRLYDGERSVTGEPHTSIMICIGNRISDGTAFIYYTANAAPGRKAAQIICFTK